MKLQISSFEKILLATSLLALFGMPTNAQSECIESVILKDPALKENYDIICISLNGMDFSFLPAPEISLQKLVDGAKDNETLTLPDAHYILRKPLHVTKNLTVIGDGTVVVDPKREFGVLRIDDPKLTVTIKNVIFVNGKGQYGGAIESNAKKLTLDNCILSNNLAYNGSGIYSQGEELYLKGCKIANNFATENGAVFSFNNNLVLEDCIFTGNKVLGKGGGLYINASEAKDVTQETPNVAVINCRFDRNEAVEIGAAIHSDGKDILLESSEFSENVGTAPINLRNAEVAVKNCSVRENFGPQNALYGGEGGGIKLDGCSATIEHCAIRGNKAIYHKETETTYGRYGSAGGIIICDSNVVLNDTIVEKNEALGDGGILIDGSSNLVVNGGSISRNIAVHTFMGDDATNGAFSGISISPGSQVTLNDVVLDSNHAADVGGAIGNMGTLNLTGKTTISGNTANQGAGIDNYGGILTIGPDVVISDNTANKGAAIYNEGAVFITTDNLYHEGTMILNGTSIVGNNATYGSAIYNDGNATLIGCELKDNPVTIGDCIWNTKHLVIRDSTIDGLKMSEEMSES